MIKHLLACLALVGLTLFPGRALADPYYGTLTQVNSTNVVTAVTTLLVTNTNPMLHIYVAYAGFEASGTNTADTIQLIAGTGATCSGSTFNILPVAVNSPAASGQIDGLIAQTATTASAGLGLVSAFYPVGLGFSLCGVTAGTTIAGYWVVVYQIAP